MKKKIRTPIFCGGYIKDFGLNVFNFRKNEFVSYISYEKMLKINLSSNLIFKIDKNNERLISILPYASYAMKILRKIKPILCETVLIEGFNIFSILLFKLLKISGAEVFILKLNTDSEIFLEDNEINKNIINNLDNDFNILKNHEITYFICFKNGYDKIIFLENEKNLKILNKINISEISIYDKGIMDSNYNKGVKYPLNYVRWDYKRNLTYFIKLIETKKINLKFVNIAKFQINKIEDIINIFKDIKIESIILFEIN